MEQTHLQPHHKHHGQHGDMPRHGAGRVIPYLIALIVLNVMLAVYTLYMLGFALEFDWTVLKSGTLQVIFESAMQLLLLFSPVILTIILNRLLYRVFRGRKRFPRGMWFFAILLMVVIQIVAVALIVSYGYAGGANGINIEQLSSAPLG